MLQANRNITSKKLIAACTFLLNCAVFVGYNSASAEGRLDAPASRTSCLAPRDLTKLSGTWTGTKNVKIYNHGETLFDVVYDITVSSQGTVRAIKKWNNRKYSSVHGFDASNKEHRKDYQKTNVYAQTEALFGLFDPVRCSLTLVEPSEEAGLFHGLLLSDGSIRYVHTQAGDVDPVVAMGTLVR